VKLRDLERKVGRPATARADESDARQDEVERTRNAAEVERFYE
jgi:hypothetical protein